MLTDYLAIGPQEVWNTVRLRAYLENVGSPFTTGSDICGCDTLTPAMLGEEAQPGDPGGIPRYTTPVLDPAPWYDPDLPVSGEFLGFLPLTVTGLQDNTKARNVTNAVGGGGIFGPVRELPRTITVTGLLLATTCCGAEYGMHYLSEALSGCTGDACDGDCVEMFNCCPDEPMTREAFVAEHRRTFRRVALVEGPREIERNGSGTCARGACGANGDVIQVEFTLVAASPSAWTDPTPLLDVTLPIGGTGDCIDWCLQPSSGGPNSCAPSDCAFTPCTAAADRCADPRNPVPRPPQPSIPETSFCIPIAPERACYTIDLSTRPQWSSDVPIVTLLAGATELRNVRVSIYERQTDTTLTCDQIAEMNRCNPLNDFYVTYIPANGSVTVDGQINTATTECGGECNTASTVFGDQDGGPLRIVEMTCASYCVCIETDPNFPPAADARMVLSVSGKGY